MKSHELDIPMAPMIDMVFLILVFFMCVSQVTDPIHAGTIDLPEGVDTVGKEADRSWDELVIYADGQIRFNGVAVEAGDLQAFLRQSRSSWAQGPLRIRADKYLLWSDLQPLVQAVTAAGRGTISITTVAP